MMAVIMVMVVRLSSHIYDRCGNCQHRRILILYELADALDNEKEEQSKPNSNEYLHFLFSLLKSTKDLTHL